MKLTLRNSAVPLLGVAAIALSSLGISGGPNYGNAGITTTGIYAGVMLPSTLFSPGQNSLGLFSITIPRTALGTGQVAMFYEGIVFSGTFTGTADPDSAKLYGEVDAPLVSSSVLPSNSNSGTVVSTVVGRAAGSLTARLKANPSNFSTASVRIEGTYNGTPNSKGADITFNASFTDPPINGDEIHYDVIGFKQAESP